MPAKPITEAELAGYNEARFLKKIAWWKHSTNEDREKQCWEWIAAVFKRRGREFPYFHVKTIAGEVKVYAKRYAFEREFPTLRVRTEDWLSNKKTLDNPQGCGNDWCVNPYHHAIIDPRKYRQQLGLDAGERVVEKPVERPRGPARKMDPDEEFMASGRGKKVH